MNRIMFPRAARPAVLATAPWVALLFMAVHSLSAPNDASLSRPSAEENVVSLDGAWRFQPAGYEEREAIVPGQWERIAGLADVHEATYRRTFAVPEAFRGQRVLLRFDAVGDFAEVLVADVMPASIWAPLCRSRWTLPISSRSLRPRMPWK